VNPVHLFGTTEIHSSNLKMFPKWRGTLELFERELKSCGPGSVQEKRVGDRDRRLARQGSDDPSLREINTEMKRQALHHRPP
jgi:hypothetical protein